MSRQIGKRRPRRATRVMAALVLAALAPAVPASDARAQDAAGSALFGGGDEPLEINAQDGIEWRRDEKQYIAKGKARAAQGEVEVFAETLIAFYREGAGGTNDIYRIEAQKDVKIVSPSETITGDLGVYTVEAGHFRVTGKQPRLETGDGDVVTARDSLEYYEKEEVAVARGNAVATHEDKRVRADSLVARFKRGAEDRLVLDRVEAEGRVEVASTTEVARGDSGVYYVDREFATLAGNVRLTQDETQLNGAFAEVDLKTGVSRLLASAPGGGQGGRVRGLLVPQSVPPGSNREPEQESGPEASQ